MRVVLVGPVYPYRGGIAHYTTRLHQAITESDHEVLLVSFSRQYPRWLFPGVSDRDPSHTALEVSTAHYWLDSLNPLTWLATFWRICCFRPQRLVLQWWTSFWAPVWLTLALLNRLWLRSPLVFLCHNVLPHDARWWERWVSWLTLRWGNRFIVQSEQERERLLHLLPSAVIDIVPHPVYTLFAGQRVPKSEARQRLNLPEDAPVLLFFGIVRPYKGLADLIEALPAVRRAVPEIRLLIAGEFWEDRANYLARIQQLQLDEIVQIDDRYLPNEEVALYFSAADALVAPYRMQTGSAVIGQAQGFGLPVVTLAPDRANGDSGGRSENLPETESRPERVAAAVLTFLSSPSAPTPTRANADEAESWRRVVAVLEGVPDR
jgi:glycosyltransferase involved in cell wall biosynthesis